MLVAVDGQTYIVVFEHGEQVETRTGPVRRRVTRFTNCIIRTVDGTSPRNFTEDYPIHSASRYMWPVDENFSYDESRKRALRRAFTEAEFDKKTRTVFWQYYLHRAPRQIPTSVLSAQEMADVIFNYLDEAFAQDPARRDLLKRSDIERHIWDKVIEKTTPKKELGSVE